MTYPELIYSDIWFYIDYAIMIAGVFFLYKIARNLRMILKEMCHIGKKIK
tara:strand:+ start:774 stop:923 length:150 start_codon:yes stop_codon:yes gene_type:complete